MRIKSRKGEGDSDLYLIIFYVLCFAALFLLSVRYVGSVALGNAFERTYIARDVALIIGIAYASPGKLEYSYPTSLGEKKFQLVVGKGSVEVEEEAMLKSSYDYATAKDISEVPEEGKIFREKMRIRKENSRIEKIEK